MTLANVLLWFAFLSCGLLAGLYFAFSAFIMRAFGAIDRAAGIAAMTAINRVILRSSFMPLFFGSTLASGALVIIALRDSAAPGAMPMLWGSALYVVGMFGVTMLFSVPLNTALERGAADWTQYLRRWTLWNHVRTAASTAAMALFALALVQGAGQP